MRKKLATHPPTIQLPSLHLHCKGFFRVILCERGIESGAHFKGYDPSSSLRLSDTRLCDLGEI